MTCPGMRSSSWSETEGAAVRLINTLSPIPRPPRWGRDAACAALAAIMFAMLFCSCANRIPSTHPVSPDYPLDGPALLDPVTELPPNVVHP